MRHPAPSNRDAARSVTNACRLLGAAAEPHGEDVQPEGASIVTCAEQNGDDRRGPWVDRGPDPVGLCTEGVWGAVGEHHGGAGEVDRSALAPKVKAKEGRMTSSPGPVPSPGGSARGGAAGVDAMRWRPSTRTANSTSGSGRTSSPRGY